MSLINHEGHEAHEGKHPNLRVLCVLRGENNVFSYDTNGNRLAQVGSTNYQYDANGNITDDGEHTYTYGSRNRLVGVDGTRTYPTTPTTCGL